MSYREPWEDRFAQLGTFVRRRQRFPQQLSPNAEEKNLHRWLRHQRARYTEGRMTGDECRQLDTLGLWRGTMRSDRETHWRNVHNQLLQYIQDTGRMPLRQSANATALEATLDVWIQTQRAQKPAQINSQTSRRAMVDATVSEWNQTRIGKRIGKEPMKAPSLERSAPALAKIS